MSQYRFPQSTKPYLSSYYRLVVTPTPIIYATPSLLTLCLVLEQELKIASLGCDPCQLLEEIFKALPGANNYETYYARQISESRRIARTHEPREYVGEGGRIYIKYIAICTHTYYLYVQCF